MFVTLSDVYQASGPHKVDVAIMDAVLAERKEGLMLTSCDMQMLMGTECRERTAQEWAKLCAKAGYSIAQMIDTRSLWKL